MRATWIIAEKKLLAISPGYEAIIIIVCKYKYILA